MATCAELSDGEILSSDDEKMEKEENSNEDDEDSGWTTVLSGPPAARKRKNSSEESDKKKKKRKRIPGNIPEMETNKLSGLVLTPIQKQMLKMCCELVQSTQAAINGNQTSFKTSDFQALIRHLVLNEPRVSGKMKRADNLRSKRVVVVWLSCVSKVDFEKKKNFQGLKALNPSVQFSIMHPGSDTYVKMGLEAFLDIEDPLNPPKEVVTISVPQESYTRKHCLLSRDNMTLHEYPFPIFNDGKVTLPPDFFQITDWSNSDTGFADEVSTYPLFSIDCEMVQTEDGEDGLARISVINEEMDCVLSKFIKPSQPIKDYRTKYSGIDEAMLVDVTVTLEDVQKELQQLLPSNCILIGHSLENDMKALKLCHPYVIDTSILFSPNALPKYKPALKHVTKKILDRDIQCGSNGHDPTEDAQACMELVKKKLESSKLVIQWRDKKLSLLSLFQHNSQEVAMADKMSLIKLYARGMTTDNACAVDTDEQAIAESSELIMDAQFTFVQLHGVEQYKRDEDDSSNDGLKRELDVLDSHVCELVGSCCQGTLVFVVCGSGYIGVVRRLQKASAPRGTLKKEVIVARTGHVVALLK